MKRRTALAIALGLAFAPSLAAAQAPAATRPTRIDLKTHSDDPALGARLEAAFRKELAGRAGYALDQALPSATLVVIANVDVHDRKNPKGVTVAIAIVSNVQVQALAYRLRDQASKDAELRDLIGGMLTEPGFIKNLNTAHMDDPTDAQIAQTAQAVVAIFLSKIPANSGG